MENTKYIKKGRYNPSNNMFIYYEIGNKCFWAGNDGKTIEVCYGPSSGGCDYWDLPMKSKKDLLQIIDENGLDTRKLLKYTRANDINKEKETKNGLGVKLNLVGKDGNAFSLLSLFRRQALKQGIDEIEVERVMKEAKSSDYSHLICTLMDNCN